jgi:PAS domain S-box-containing protein
MSQHPVTINKTKFFRNIILPTFLTIGLFLGLMFWFIIPYFELNLMNAKKQMIREIVYSSICIAAELDQEVIDGKITMEEARDRAVQSISAMRYGTENKDYLWITDLQPVMIRHPYRTELNGQDLSDFTDAQGKKMFVEFVTQTRETGEAYVDYMWWWMDDTTRILPKISFVMEYKPWGWLIGTGVYLEDIRKEISGIKKILVYVSLAIFLLMTVLLTIIVRRNLRVETQRSIAEQNLKESRERYKALVEASTDGTLLFMEGKCIYANKKMKDMLGDTDLGYLSNDLREIIHPDRQEDIRQILEFQGNNQGLLQMETILSFADQEYRESLITISQVALSDKNGFIYVIKDLVRSDRQASEAALTELGPAMNESLSVGVFTANMRGKGRFTAFSPALPALLGFGNAEELKKISILDLIENSAERREFTSYLARHRKLDGYRLSIKKPMGGLLHLLVYAVLLTDEITGTDKISGIFVDYGSIRDGSEVKSEAVNASIARQALLDSPATRFMQPPVFCSEDASQEDIVRLMHFHSAPAVFVKNIAGWVTGSVSAREILDAVVNAQTGNGSYAGRIMNNSIHWFDESGSLSGALSAMEKGNISCLAVKGNDQQVQGTVTRESLAGLLHTGDSFREPSTMEQLIEQGNRLPQEVKMLLDSGVKAPAITQRVTQHSDQATAALVKMILRELGQPPAKFAFIALGSEARREQTLLTDQDNALIYDDQAAGSQEAATYFLQFGKRMNQLLHTAGYELCKGDIMAGNPRWNQPLSVWKKYFAGWITEATPQNIVDVSVFFDYRTIYGDNALTNELRDSIHTVLNNTPAFLGYMAMANLSYKIPLTIFGRLQTDTSEDNSGTINIKNASRVMVNIIRLYSVKSRLEETNTLSRLHRLYALNVIPHHMYADLSYAFEFLLVTQFRHQVFAITNRLRMDHNINLSMLSSIETNTLKTIFSVISTFQNRLKNDFGVNI